MIYFNSERMSILFTLNLSACMEKASVSELDLGDGCFVVGKIKGHWSSLDVSSWIA